MRSRIAIGIAVAAAALAVGTTDAQIIPKQQVPLSRLKPPSSGAVCAPGRSCAEIAPQVIQSAEGPSPLAENLRYLTDTIGGRVSGSDAADKATGWAVEAFQHAGVDEVHTEKFTIPVGWSEGKTHADVLAPARFPVRLVSTGWSPPTLEGGITANVVDLGNGDAADFAKAGATVNGAIVLVHSKILITWDDLENEYAIAPGIIARAKKAGAAAIFWMSTRPNLLLYRHSSSVDGKLEDLPQAIVAREDALRIARFLAAGEPVRVHFEMPNHVTGPIESENVLAEIRGSEKPDDFVLLGAHLDSWDLGTGALDDGCNAAMVIDVARVLRTTGSIPRRSIRFALFTGEEQGMLGSWAYARAHRSELDQMVAAVIFDSGDGRVTGYSLGGRGDTLTAVRDALEPLRRLGVRDFTLDAEADTDNFDFLLEGVPTLVANQDPANYMLNYHAFSDTYDKVDIPALKKQVAIAALTVYALANDEQRVGLRQTRTQIEKLLERTGLEQGMKTQGLWSEWSEGERGRAVGEP
ncbi:MAG TPA: M28 family peptidase [Candidatus Acidoferrum sp.]|nr:M28 family peptidase [Candidatus Acidoferrum sp.]